MVTAALSDALSNPLLIIKELQAAHKRASDSSTFATVVKSHFKDLFGSPANLQKIPPLDVLHPPESYASGSLVKFRAMVQDTSASPEIYVPDLGFGLDSCPTQDDSFDMREMDEALNEDDIMTGRERWLERTVFWAVTVPGESEWVSKSLDGAHAPAAAAAGVPLEKTNAHKFPLPSTSHVGAMIKSYGGTEFRPSYVHNFVGVLTFDPQLNLLDESAEEALLPSLHVLFHAPASSTLIKSSYPLPPARGKTNLEVKNEIVHWLASEALDGDTLAAEYVLLCALGRVTRTGSTALLPPSLLLSHFPASLLRKPQTLQTALQQLLPVAATLPLSIPYLNDHPFAPSSSVTHESEDLRSGALQLAPGTCVLITEHGVGEGKLGDLGVRNITTLQTALASQTLAYAFPFSSYEFPTDLSFIVLCEGSKSPFVTTDINLPLVPSSYEASTAECATPFPEQLQEWRVWLSGAKSQAASKSPVAISSELADYIQSEFVRERKEAQTKGGDNTVTSEDLGLRMTLAKLLALLRHEDGLTQEIWNEVVSMEQKRKSRSRK